MRGLLTGQSKHRATLREGPLVEDPLPRCAAVSLERKTPRSSFGPEGVTKCRNVDEVWVFRMDLNLANVPGVGEPQMLPRSARHRPICRRRHLLDISPNARLAHPSIDHVRIGRETASAPTAAVLKNPSETIAPGDPAVGRFPDSTCTRPEVERHAGRHIASDRDDTSARDAARCSRQSSAFSRLFVTGFAD